MQIRDVIVVGAGAIGTWIAKRLTEGGANVTLLDAGPPIHVAHDFSVNSNERDTTPDRCIQSLSTGCRGIRRRFFVDDADNVYTTPPSKPFFWIRGRQVGGRLHVWSRHAPRVSNLQLRPEQPDDPRHWPLSYEMLRSSYDRIESRLGIVGEVANIPCIPDGIFRPSRKLSPLEHHIKFTIESHLPAIRVTSARTICHNPNRIPIPLQDALDTNRLLLLPNTIVARVRFQRRQSRIWGLEVIDRVSRRSFQLPAEMIILAASPFESVRILLNSLANVPLLGRYICDHLFVVEGGSLSSTQRQMLFDTEPSDPWDFGADGLYIPGQRSETGAFLGEYGIQLKLDRDNGRWYAFAFGEMFPRFQNRLAISSAVDAWGIPALHIDCSHGNNERKMVSHIRSRIAELAEICGLSRQPMSDYLLPLASSGALMPGLAIHEAGGAKLGTSPENSVLDTFGQSWQIRNLFLLDAGCFPSLPFQNPTLTAMAVADRTCDVLVAKASV